MKLLGRARLKPLCGLDAATDKWLTSWTAEVAYAFWKQPSDVTAQFPKVRTVGPSLFRFNVPERQEAIELEIAFQHDIALVTSLIKLSENS